MWPTYKLSNGKSLEVQQRIQVRALQDIEGDLTRRPILVKKGSKVELHHWPSNQLTLVKPASGSNRFNDVKAHPVEGVDYELIPDAEPFPERKVYKQINIMDLF